jgi:DNA-binding NarL/FixJ family response regulator
MLALVTEDQDAQDRHIVAARAAAIQSADVDLEFAALGFEGWSLVARGQVSAGMALLDEAAAAATGGEVSDLATIADIYCKMLMACELALDVRRAEQWMTVVESLSRRTQCLAPPLLYCRTSYCGILVARGRWADAEAELELSLQAAASEWEALRAGAIIRLANVRLGQGRLDEADELLAGYEHEPSATRPLARLYVAQGEVERAAALLRRQLSSPQPVIERAGVLALVVETELAAGRTDRGREAAAQLQQLSEASDAPLLAILGHWAAGLVACATSDDHAAAYLESAISGFGNADLSFEEARARLQLAKTAAATNRPLAITEARTALARFEQLSAAPYADDAARFLRELGVTARSAPRSKGTLTQRERQVLGLLAEGLTNEQIATRLYVSTRTAEHHVSNILSKLGVRNRASAVAYAIRHPVEHHGRA